jgi:hypothetical protein
MVTVNGHTHYVTRLMHNYCHGVCNALKLPEGHTILTLVFAHLLSQTVSTRVCLFSLRRQGNKAITLRFSNSTYSRGKEEESK